MKNWCILLLLFISVTSFAQQIGVTKLKVEGEYTKKTSEKLNEWLDADTFYIKTYDHNPVGIMHAVTELESIIAENNGDFDKPMIDETLLSEIVDNIKDYENLDLTIDTGNSEVRKTWMLSGKILSMTLNKELYMLVVQKK